MKKNDLQRKIIVGDVEKSVLKIAKGSFIVKTITLAFLIAFNNQIQDELENAARFESPVVFILCLLNVLDYFLIFEACITKNIFETQVYISIVIAEFVYSLLQLFVDLTSLKNDFLPLLIIYSVICFLHIFIAVYIYLKSRKFFADSTLKTLGSNINVFYAYKYKQQLFVLGKIIFIQPAISLLSIFIENSLVSTSERIWYRVIRSILVLMELISIYLKPYSDSFTLKMTNFIVFGADIIVLTVSFVLDLVERSSGETIFDSTVSLLYMGTIFLNCVVLYSSFFDYKYFNSGLKDIIGKKSTNCR